MCGVVGLALAHRALSWVPHRHMVGCESPTLLWNSGRQLLPEQKPAHGRAEDLVLK